jgi:uncharacterized protein
MLKDQLYTDIITAMKSGEKLKTEALKMIKAEIMKQEVSGANVTVSDEDVVQILTRAVKQRKEAAEGFEKGGNQEAANKELQEAEIYQAYLPEQMSEEQITTIVKSTIDKVGASGPQDMGKVMGAIMGKVKGKADGGMVKNIVQQLLKK